MFIINYVSNLIIQFRKRVNINEIPTSEDKQPKKKKKRPSGTQVEIYVFQAAGHYLAIGPEHKLS